MLWIKGGRLVDPGSGFDGLADLAIEDGRIAKVERNPGPVLEAGENGQVIDATGMVVAPGLVDIHVHFRDPGLTYKEDIQTGAKAAARGGFTTVVCMANTKPPVDNIKTLEHVLQEGRKTRIHVLQACAITKGLKGQELTDMALLKAHGAAGFTDDGIALKDGRLVKMAMEEARRLEAPLSFHEEDSAFIVENGVNHGAVSEKLGLFGSPALAEDSLVARDCMIALDTGASLNIQHISSANAVKMVKLAKELGAQVTAEVTPHHLALTEEAVLSLGTLAKMNPPLRTEKDRRALVEGLKDGTIDIIATDHAPHASEEKARPFTQAPSGIIGLETALALALTVLVRPGHLTLVQLMEKMSLNPARLYQLEGGRAQVGSPGDLVVFDPGEKWRVEGFASKSANSPFVGKELYGKVKYTICGGRVAYQDGMEQS